MTKNPFDNDFTKNLLEIKKSKAKQAESWSISLTPGWLSKSRLTVKEKRSSLAGLIACVSLIFILFVLQLTSLQLVKGQQLANRADGNRIRDNVSFAPRGKILDRNGKVLADNSASVQLVVSPYLLPKQKQDRQAEYKLISNVTKTPGQTIGSIAESKGLDSILPVLIDGKLSQDEAIKLDLILPKLNGFSLDTIPVRKYQKDAAFGTILGYVGRASESDVKARDDILPIDFVGQAGIEQFYDSTLRGTNGGKRTEVDASGHPIRVLANDPSKPGKDLKLSIDLKLQKTLQAKLSEQMKASGGKVGSAVALNPKTGEVLAIVSLPSYDNNMFAGGISETDFKNFTSNPLTPLFNRVISSGYPTGSATKPLVAAAALQEKVITEDTVIVDRGKITLVNKYNPADAISFSNFEGGVNGPIKIRQAIAKSSNVFFYTLGGGDGPIKGLGPYRLPNYYRKFGLGKKTGIDLPGENGGVVPDPNWNKKNLGTDWFTGDSYNIAIGQGNMQVSPIQLAVAQAAIVNGGKVLKPHIAMGKTEIVGDIGIDQKYLNIVREGMKEAVEYGTVGAANFNNVPVKVGAKTGTAETVTRSESKRPHVWIAANAPYDNPEILVVAMIENGTSSGKYLGPVAASVFEEYFR